MVVVVPSTSSCTCRLKYSLVEQKEELKNIPRTRDADSDASQAPVPRSSVIASLGIRHPSLANAFWWRLIFLQLIFQFWKGSWRKKQPHQRPPSYRISATGSARIISVPIFFKKVVVSKNGVNRVEDDMVDVGSRLCEGNEIELDFIWALEDSRKPSVFPDIVC